MTIDLNALEIFEQEPEGPGMVMNVELGFSGHESIVFPMTFRQMTCSEYGVENAPHYKAMWCRIDNKLVNKTIFRRQGDGPYEVIPEDEILKAEEQLKLLEAA